MFNSQSLSANEFFLMTVLESRVGIWQCPRKWRRMFWQPQHLCRHSFFNVISMPMQRKCYFRSNVLKLLWLFIYIFLTSLHSYCLIIFVLSLVAFAKEYFHSYLRTLAMVENLIGVSKPHFKGPGVLRSQDGFPFLYYAVSLPL